MLRHYYYIEVDNMIIIKKYPSKFKPFTNITNGKT